MKKIYYLLLSLCLLLIGVVGVKAERITDFSKIGSEVIFQSETSHAYPYLKISGFESYVENLNDDEDDYDYIVYISNNSNLPNDITYDNYYREDYNMHSLKNYVQDEGFDITDYYILSGDIYFTIYEVDFSTRGVTSVTTPTKIERVAKLPLEKRTEGVFAYDGTVIINLEPVAYNQKVNYKIGIINDNNLLRDLKNNKSGSVDALLKYAKEDSTGITGTTYDGASDHIINNLNLIDNKYYYILIIYDNENGKYYDLEDIWVSQASVYDNGEWFLFSRYDSSFSWNLEEEKIDTVWENFVKSVKENELLKDNEDVTITYDADSMDITANNITITFNYNNGIVSYEAKEMTDDKLIGVSVYEGILLEEFFESFKYDPEKVLKYLEENPNLTITKDGFEYVLKEIEYKDETTEISTGVFTTLKFDIINGLKTYKPNADEKIPDDKAPETGFWLGMGSLGLLLTISLSGLYINKKMKKENKIVKL